MLYIEGVRILLRVDILEDIEKGTIMSLEDNKTIARRFIEECILQGNMDVYDASFSPDLIVHLYGTPTHSHGSFRALASQINQAFAGHSLTMGDVIAEGDTVALHFSYKASTHHAHFGKNPPTRQPFQVEEMAFFRFEQGKVVEMWALYQGADLDLSPA